MLDEAQTGADPRSTRRSIIKRTVAATSVVWAAPAIIDSLTNPAAAASCAAGKYYVAFQGAMGSSITPIANSCTPTDGTYVNVNATTFGLTATWSNGGSGTNSLAHVASTTGNRDYVNIAVTNGCQCRITRVVAHVHLRGPGNCPTDACQVAGTGTNDYLKVTAGALGTTSVQVRPNYENTALCAAGIHWGASASQTSPVNKNAEGGYILIEVTCP